MKQFTEKVYHCRTRTVVKLYKSIYDINASKQVMLEDTDFVSKKQYLSDTISFVLISECDDPAMVNYWCPMSSIYHMEDTTPVEEPKPDVIGTLVNKTANINGSDIKVYKDYTSSSSIATGLKPGDSITLSQEVEISINGKLETRYLISDTTSDDRTVIGKWITHNTAVTVNDVKVDIPTPGVDIGTTKPRKAVKALPSTSNNIVGYTAVVDLDTSAGTPTSVATGDYSYYNETELTAKYEEFKSNVLATSSNEDLSIMGNPIGRMIFVHGMPFQYTGITDRRLRGAGKWGETYFDPHSKKSSSSNVDAYGRSFATNIAANIPIAVIVPGKPVFVSKIKEGLFSSNSGSRTTRGLFSGFFNDNMSDDQSKGLLEQLDNGNEGDYQYYNIELDTTTYFKYVNSLCQVSARLMGLVDTKYHGKYCHELDWGKYNSASDQDYSTFEQVMGVDGGVSFAYDPVSSVSDSISNSTGESQYASKFNSIASSARELEFISGMALGDAIDMVDSSNYTEAATRTLTNNGLGSGAKNLMSTIKTGLANASKGMNMRFPEIWQDSQYGKSYDISMHFIAPYATQFCKWRYVLVPFFHIFALAAPTNKGNVNVYSRPFLIKAFSKGYFNVEMGIIDSIQWKRFGDGDMISSDGIPMQIDVDITFKDMYQTLAMSSIEGDNVAAFFNNTGLIDMVGTLSGVNMNKMSLSDRVSLYVASGYKRFRDLDDNFMRSISDRMAQFTNTYLLGI